MVSLLTLTVGLVCLTAHTWACCTPDKWEGFQGSQAGYAGFRKRGSMKEFNSVHYDFTNKRTAVFMNIVNGHEEHKFQAVTHCDKDDKCVVYVVDLKKDKCWTKEKSRGFRKACIPDDAKDLGEFSLGLKGVFKVHSYEVKKHIKRGAVEASVTVSMIDDGVCVPIGENVSGVMKRVGFMETVGFIDITAGIKNETVFDVPKQCEDNLDLDIEAEFERDHFILAI